MARPPLDPESHSERLHMAITKAEIDAIDDWRYANRIPTRSAAIRRLIQLGLLGKSSASLQSGGE